MKELSSVIQAADWKKEKHVPVIDAPERAKPGENIQVNVSVGREIAHPNTTEHHIAWIDVFFQPQDGKFAYHLGRFEFHAHGASTEGPNTSTVFTHPSVTLTFKTDKPGSLFALSYCNIHGLWMGAHELEIA